MFLPTPHDAKDAISKYAGFFGMVVSIAFALNLILPTGETLSNAPKLVASILISIFLGWLSFAIKSKNKP
jgi:flagellar biosynthesis protein FliQ